MVAFSNELKNRKKNIHIECMICPSLINAHSITGSPTNCKNQTVQQLCQKNLMNNASDIAFPNRIDSKNKHRNDVIDLTFSDENLVFKEDHNSRMKAENFTNNKSNNSYQVSLERFEKIYYDEFKCQLDMRRSIFSNQFKEYSNKSVQASIV